MNTTTQKDQILVLGATGHVGSQVVKTLASKGLHVKALIRSPNKKIFGLNQEQENFVEYVIGDLLDHDSIERAISGVTHVVSTANAIIPGKKGDSVSKITHKGYENLISACERAGIKQFIQSSVPAHKMENKVPELWTKREIETQLTNSKLNYTIVRNPAFMDVWLVMTGFKQAASKDKHATTQRPYGFMQTYIKMVGNLAIKRGILLAPGGPDHGAAFISTTDVAHMMAACIDQKDSFRQIIEAGGPQWITWKQAASMVSETVGHQVRPITFPAWLAAVGRILTKPFMPSASNILALTQFVATYQPHWESSSWVKKLDLPPQITLEHYLNNQYSKQSLEELKLSNT